jgi:Elongation factor G C-terminus
VNSFRLIQNHAPMDHAARWPEQMAYPDYPIERQVRSNAHDFQLAFAEEAATRLHERFDDALLEASRTGLRILARHEQALKPPTDAVKALYPWQLEVGIPRVRCWEGDVTREPIMFVRVKVPRRYAEVIRKDLAERTSRPVGYEHAYDKTEVTATARLAQLLGYAESLDTFTRGTCDVRISLSEYAPIEPPSGPDAA